jgi:UDPglucose--hexose-1-phosphate uridylyltransferase
VRTQNRTPTQLGLLERFHLWATPNVQLRDPRIRPTPAPRKVILVSVVGAERRRTVDEIQFERFEDEFQVLNPLKGFAREVQRVEVRIDPLLGHCSVYNPLLRGKVKMFVGDVDRELVESLAKESARTCFFCPERIDRVARFPEDLIPEGVIRVGETALFPNLFSLGRHHAVAALSRAHFLELREFTPELLADAFRALQRLLLAIEAKDPDAVHATVNANYLFPAGASLMHPHFQLLATAVPYTHQAHLLAACRHYLAGHGRPYHTDLIAAERALGSRYIARTEGWDWIAAYAPTGSNEIVGVHEANGDLAQLADHDLQALARGLSATLRLYESLGHLSFNFSLYSRREEGEPDGFHCLIRCITRQNPYPNYRTDDFFLQRGLQSEIMLRLPEDLAAAARSHFGE